MKMKIKHPQLNPKKTFKNFIESDCNRMVRTVGLSIAEQISESTYNPFFIYGSTGGGKTHLINAIGMRCMELYPKKRVLYVSARQFQMEFTDSVRKNTTKKFISFYQSLDLLIVDDIQEWMNSPKTLDSFFHIFNYLIRNERQIILASDRPPVDLQGIKKRLITHFASGLIAKLEKPNEKLCIDILNAKFQRGGLQIPADVAEFIAKNANGNVCILESVINSLIAYYSINKTNIDMNLVEHVIKLFTK